MKNTLLIMGGRRSGKTIELIKKSAETGIYILVADNRRARILFDQAKDLGYTIPYPVTWHEYIHSNRFTGSFIRKQGIYIDDADHVMGEAFKGIDIHAISFEIDKNDVVLEPAQWPKVNPVYEAYRILESVLNKKEGVSSTSEAMCAIEEAVGYLGEALE